MAVSDKIFEKICELIEIYPDSIKKCCEKQNVDSADFFRLLDDAAKFRRYARAKARQIDASVDHIKQLEDQCIGLVDTIEDPRKANTLVQAYKIKIDNIKWIASKLQSKVYGEHVNHAVDIETLQSFITSVGRIISEYVPKPRRDKCLSEVSALMDRLDAR